jgi:protein gp37
MSGKTKIEWTEMSWNPVTGCTKISPGCMNCYAEKFAFRLQRMGVKQYKNGFKVTLQRNALKAPYTWKSPRRVFVNSMSDLFHKDIPLSYIKEVFNVMNDCKHIQFQILTKRSERLLELNDKLNWSDNIWMGVTVEMNEYVYRIKELKEIDSKIKFISFEPLLGPIGRISLKGIDWVIVGGESGAGARPIKEEWVLKLRDMSEKESIPFFFKQWGGFNKHKTGKLLEGKIYNDYPVESEPIYSYSGK